MNATVAFLKASQFQSVAVADPFNVDFDAVAWESIRANKRQLIWLSQCTQPNMLVAIEKFGASLVGFANENKS